MRIAAMDVVDVSPPYDVAEVTAMRAQSYTHVIAATGSRLVFVAGQLSEDAQGDLVGSGDLAAQAQQAFANREALAAAGATTPVHADLIRDTCGLRRPSPGQAPAGP